MIKAVVFDWAGTMVDFGSRAPMDAFVRLFADEGITISIAQARGPMGINKWEHIDALLHTDGIREQWFSVKGRGHGDGDVDTLLAKFKPMNLISIRECAELIPGAREVVVMLRAKGIRIGATTGYTRDLLDVLMPLASAQGYDPDVSVCAGETPRGRPHPDMVLRCAELLGIADLSTVIKVDDTAPGIREGTAAGCWTVGVSASGNGVGLSYEAFWALSNGEREDLESRAREELLAAGADAVVSSVADLCPVIESIEQRIAEGEKPGCSTGSAIG
jgi:phosphonoacetaldehyde hydrolase